MAERGHDVTRHQRLIVRRHKVERIEAHHLVAIARIEEHHVIDPPRRHQIEDLVDQVTVGVDQGDPFPTFDILGHQVLEQGRLAGAGLTDHVDMPAPVGGGDAEIVSLAPDFPSADV